MEEEHLKFAVGYIKVNDLDDKEEIKRQSQLIENYCRLNDLKLIVTFGDEHASGKNFSGPGWQKMEAMVKMTNVLTGGMIGTLVVSSADMLSRDVSLYLLKERELKQEGITIDVASGRGQNLTHHEILLN